MEKKILNSLSLLLYLGLLTAGIYFLRGWFLGTTVGLPWQVETTYQTQPLLLDYFRIDGNPSGIFVDQVLALQRFYTEDILFSTMDHQFVLVAFIMTMILITAFISFLDRSSYLLAAGAICLMLTQLQLEALAVFPAYLTYAVVVLFLVPSYYFQAFKPTASISLRLVISLLSYAIIIIGIQYFSPVVNVTVVSLSYGILGPLIISTLLLLFIAGENIFTIFKVATTAQPGKKGLIHFSIIGTVYLGLCFLLFYQKENGLAIDIDYLDPRFLILLSTFSAFLSFNQRHENYNQSSIKLFKHILFPVASITLLLTYTLATNSLNDSLQNALDWMIIITHLCMGISYFAYALINFAPELIQGLPVWKVFYSGQRTAILTLRLFGFILCIGAFLYLENRPYYSAQAAQYNMLADLAKNIGGKEISKSYFEQAIFNDYYSFKANYTLLEQAEKDFDQAEARSRVSNLIERQDNAVARLQLANDYANEKRLYQSLDILRKAENAMANDQLLNNLGLAHFYYANYDSAYLYFNQANTIESSVNEWAVRYLLKNRITTSSAMPAKELPERLNQQAVANQQGWMQEFSYEFNEDTVITKNDLYYLYNAAVSRKQKDYATIILAIDYYLENPKNDLYNNFLITAKAFAHYHNGEVNEAFNTIDNTINRNPTTSGFETYLKAIWCFDQGLAEKAVKYVNLAQERGYQEEQIKLFIDQVQRIENYEEKADISEALVEALTLVNEESKRNALIEVASKNAFDEKSTLNAIDALRDLETAPKTIYDLLVQASKLNDQSPELLEAYILQCEKMNLSGFADSGLERYGLLVPYEQYFNLAKQINDLRENQ